MANKVEALMSNLESLRNAEVISIEGESYRLKEARERSEQRTSRRRKTKS